MFSAVPTEHTCAEYALRSLRAASVAEYLWLYNAHESQNSYTSSQGVTFALLPSAYWSNGWFRLNSSWSGRKTALNMIRM